jgi:hypothetical protein
MTLKDYNAAFFGLIAIYAWYNSLRLARQPAGDRRTARSRWLAHVFTGILTITEVILVASLLFSG